MPQFEAMAANASAKSVDSRDTISPGSVLRKLLLLADLSAIAATWLLITIAPHLLGRPARRTVVSELLWGALAIGVTMLALWSQRLYLARVHAVPAVEVQRVGRATALAGVVLLAGTWLAGGRVAFDSAVAGLAVSWTLLLFSRATLRAWLAQARRQGGFTRSLLVVGERDEAQAVLDLASHHPELGYRMVGYVAQGRFDGLDVPWVGQPVDIALLTQLTEATEVLVTNSGLESAGFERVLRDLRPLDVHVHLAANAPDVQFVLASHGLALSRGSGLKPWQQSLKRVFDVVMGSALAVVGLPLMVATAAIIRLASPGPILERRLFFGGHDGRPLVVPVLRTQPVTSMSNRRRGLALGVGRLCRAMRIHQLPQLWNVLSGSMSLVGPRPLAHGRSSGSALVPPGLTGLSQLEAGDYPELGPHRRVDRFYADNWSVGFDFSIIAATALHIFWPCARELTRVFRRRTAHGAAFLAGAAKPEA